MDVCQISVLAALAIVTVNIIALTSFKTCVYWFVIRISLLASNTNTLFLTRAFGAPSTLLRPGAFHRPFLAERFAPRWAICIASREPWMDGWIAKAHTWRALTWIRFRGGDGVGGDGGGGNDGRYQI